MSNCTCSGTDVMIFAEKFCEKIGVFLIQNKAKIRKTKLIITLVFEKDANFFAENRRKSPKIAENRRKL
jgi:hypothetical protein